MALARRGEVAPPREVSRADALTAGRIVGQALSPANLALAKRWQAKSPALQRRPRRPLACGRDLVLQQGGGTRGSRADGGVRPTIFRKNRQRAGCGGLT